jgi:hypothetical protein
VAVKDALVFNIAIVQWLHQSLNGRVGTCSCGC